MNWLRNDFLVIALIILVAVSMGLVSAFAPVQAASEPEVVCVEWANASPWVLTRCEDEYTGEVCISSTSGMLSCRVD
jgi:hypothetical protein